MVSCGYMKCVCLWIVCGFVSLCEMCDCVCVIVCGFVWLCEMCMIVDSVWFRMAM